MILDCSSYESSKLSLANIFNTTEERLLSTLRSLDPYKHNYLPPEDALYSSVCDAFSEPENDLSILWFHGTRVLDKNVFYKQGILPKSEARKLLEPRLKEMAGGLKHSGSNPFALSLFGKAGPQDEGPFAFLIRDVVIQAPAPHHNYLDAPEMVEDIAGTLLGDNYIQLVARFKEITQPCIVSFLSVSKGYELPHALMYLKLVGDGETDIEAASSANTCFDSEGAIVFPENIQSVEFIL
jgi:hypothetical protein